MRTSAKIRLRDLRLAAAFVLGLSLAHCTSGVFSSLGRSHASSSAEAEKPASGSAGRPSDDPEEIGGYLTNPGGTSVSHDGAGGLRIVGVDGSVVATKGAVESLPLRVLQIGPNDISAATVSGAGVHGTVIGRFSPTPGGAFDVHVTADPSRFVVVALGSGGQDPSLLQLPAPGTDGHYAATYLAPAASATMRGLTATSASCPSGGRAVAGRCLKTYQAYQWSSAASPDVLIYSLDSLTCRPDEDPAACQSSINATLAAGYKFLGPAAFSTVDPGSGTVDVTAYSNADLTVMSYRLAGQDETDPTLKTATTVYNTYSLFSAAGDGLLPLHRYRRGAVLRLALPGDPLPAGFVDEGQLGFVFP